MNIFYIVLGDSFTVLIVILYYIIVPKKANNLFDLNMQDRFHLF